MTLTTHIIVAGAVAAPLLHNPPLAFVVGITSHYLLDAIPHWDWELSSLPQGDPQNKNGIIVRHKKIAYDLLRVTLDVSIGLLLLFAIGVAGGGINSLIIFYGLGAAALGGILPDALQFAYFVIWRKQPMAAIQWFHDFFHARTKIPHRQMARGLAYQTMIIAPSLIFLVFVLVMGENVW